MSIYHLDTNDGSAGYWYRLDGTPRGPFDTEALAALDQARTGDWPLGLLLDRLEQESPATEEALRAFLDGYNVALLRRLSAAYGLPVVHARRATYDALVPVLLAGQP